MTRSAQPPLRGCRICSIGSPRPKRALHLRHPEGQPTPRMSDLRQRFFPAETDTAFPTSRGPPSAADVGFAATVCRGRNERCISDIQPYFLLPDVGFAASVCSGRNERCISDIQPYFPLPDVGFAASVPSDQNERCISDMQASFPALDVGFAATVCRQRNRYCISDIRPPPPPPTGRTPAPVCSRRKRVPWSRRGHERVRPCAQPPRRRCLSTSFCKTCGCNQSGTKTGRK